MKSKFEYISVKWIHAVPDQPIVFISELDQHRMESRKLEYYKNGQVGWATRKRSVGKTVLAESPIASKTQLESDPQFEIEEIDREEFDAQWNVYV